MEIYDKKKAVMKRQERGRMKKTAHFPNIEKNWLRLIRSFIHIRVPDTNTS